MFMPPFFIFHHFWAKTRNQSEQSKKKFSLKKSISVQFSCSDMQNFHLPWSVFSAVLTHAALNGTWQPSRPDARLNPVKTLCIKSKRLSRRSVSAEREREKETGGRVLFEAREKVSDVSVLFSHHHHRLFLKIKSENI